MNRWILDTDHVSLLLRGNSEIVEQSERRYSRVVTTIITVQEVYNGWVGKTNNASDPDRLVELYAKLSRTVTFIKSVPILNFDESAKNCYVLLRQQNPLLTKKRLEKDLRIAAIALSQRDTLVTRNAKDFELVPGLRFESWV